MSIGRYKGIEVEDFQEKVLADLAELKAHMRWVVGNGNQGKIQEIEERLNRHEAHLQRMVGMGSAIAAGITVMNLVVNFMRLHR